MNSNNENNLEIKRHSLCHVMSLAVKRLYGEDIKLGVGPVIDNGFYQDFDYSFSESDLAVIEKEMKKIIRADYAISRSELSLHDAREHFSSVGQLLKVELLDDLKEKGSTHVASSKAKANDSNRIVSLYQIDSHLDLCRGPHVASSGKLSGVSFKLERLAGAYWRGNESNKMLSRIYGVAFESEEELSQYLERKQEAKRRDHRVLGEQHQWFFFHESAPGMPYWLPKGLKIKNLLVQYWREYHEHCGYQEIAAPLINKRELWEISGHWQHYKDDMISVDLGDGEEWALKPMNCANAMLVWKSRLRSYKELPLRLSDTDVLHRNEASGSLQGMMRARCFCQDDSHNFVAEDQIQSEIRAILEIVRDFYDVFGLVENVKLYLATRPEKFMGSIQDWDQAEAELLEVLQDSGLNYGIKDKEGAFYAPKIDIHLEDALGREWQCGTIQVDYQLPKNFELEYVAKDGSRKSPVVIHRVIYGSIERFLGILIEHFAGKLPFWIAPLQVRVLPIGVSDSYVASIQAVLDRVVLAKPLKFNQLRYEIDDRSESLGRKVRDAELEKIPVLLIAGSKEAANGAVSLRVKDGEQCEVQLCAVGEKLVQMGHQAIL